MGGTGPLRSHTYSQYTRSKGSFFDPPDSRQERSQVGLTFGVMFSVRVCVRVTVGVEDGIPVSLVFLDASARRPARVSSQLGREPGSICARAATRRGPGKMAGLRLSWINAVFRRENACDRREHFFANNLG